MIWRCDLLPQYKKYKKEIDNAIAKVLNSGRYTLASEISCFEKEAAAYFGVKHAIGVASGTDALLLSLMAYGIGKGDEVITTPFTAIPTVSAIIASGATPVFVDICEDTFLIDLEKISKAVSSKTKAVIPVHLFGNVVNVPGLREVIGPNIPIIEDAAQAHASTIDNVKAGSMGDLGAFSFYPTKNLGAYGDGGMVVTNKAELAEKIKLFRMYGMVDKDNIVVNGINSRLDEIQAAILRVKLKYLDAMNKRRNEIAACYISELRSDFIKYQTISKNVFSNYHIFNMRVEKKRNDLVEFLQKENIQTNIYYLVPLHLQKANKFLGYKEGSFPVTEKLCKEIIALPMYAELKQEHINKIISKINQFWSI